MNRMDQLRRTAGLTWVAAGLAFELLLMATEQVRPGAVTVALCSIVLLLALLVAADAPRALVVAARRVTAIALALDFAGAVADRFGALGPPGRSGVSWGSWASFVDYTQVLLLGVPRQLAVAAAVSATAVEVVLSVLLVTGHQRRWVGKGSAGLLVVYLVSMAVSIGLGAVATYALPVLIGGALLISACPPRHQGQERRIALPTTQPRPSGVHAAETSWLVDTPQSTRKGTP